MNLLALLVVLIVVGIGLYCINRFIPMDQSIKTILNVVVIIVVLIFVLNAFGVLDSLRSIQVPKVG